MPQPDYLLDLGHDVYAVDTGFERDRFDAAYLVVSEGHAAFIDTGHNAAVPRLLGALDALGLSRQAVDWVIPTHVHLDHAGGAGLLMRELPGALMLIHPRGARHMIDPSALMEGARGVYGDEKVAQTYGELVPVPAERVVESRDGLDLDLAGRILHLIDTPGHARHHHCIWDARSRGWFTGDTFGISYPEFDGPRGRYIFPSSTPVQFDPPALRASIERMLSHDPACIYPTHFGRLAPVAPLAEQVLAQLDTVVRGALAIGHDPAVTPEARPQALQAMVLASMVDAATRQGCPLAADEMARLLAVDAELNAAGIAVWLDKTLASPS